MYLDFSDISYEKYYYEKTLQNNGSPPQILIEKQLWCL